LATEEDRKNFEKAKGLEFIFWYQHTQRREKKEQDKHDKALLFSRQILTKGLKYTSSFISTNSRISL
jgi:hypothetical protein